SQGLPATGALDEATRQALLPSKPLPGAHDAKPEASRQALPPSEPPPEAGETKAEPWLKAPPGGEFKKVSSLVQLPDFVSGLGTLYVDPATLPKGPFLAYDRQGNLVSSVYMLPIRDLREGKSFTDLAVARVHADPIDV